MSVRCWALAVCFAANPLLCLGRCRGRFFGLCNYYNASLTFMNLETPSEFCTAEAGGVCKIPSYQDEGSWIPRTDRAANYPLHHAELRGSDGVVHFNLWLDDHKRAVRGGYDYGAGKTLTMCGDEYQYNVVVSENGTVSLWNSGFWNSCPIPRGEEADRCLEINSKSGSWVAISSTSVEEEVEIETGVEREHEVASEQSWGWSVSEAISFGFDVFGAVMEIEVSSKQAGEMARSYTDTFTKSTTTKETYGPFEAGTIWQWQWIIVDGCGTTKVAGNDIVGTRGKWQPPCCLPGFFAEPENPNGECHAGSDGEVYNLCQPETNSLKVV